MADIVERQNPFGNAMAASRQGALISIEQQRAIGEVQARYIRAMTYRRDPKEALDRILMDCTDPELAQEAEYEFARAGTKISGPSIRLLETVAARWGNLLTGVYEIGRYEGYSEHKAFAEDLESGWRDERVFHVKHWRDSEKKGSTGYAVTSERDVYEVSANMGARRKRACMEAVIPSDIVRKALEQCRLTMKAKVDINDEFIKSLLSSFEEFGVSKEMIEQRIQRHVSAITPGLAIQLKRIHTSLKTEMGQVSDFFDVAPTAVTEHKTTGAAALKEKVANTRNADPDQEKLLMEVLRHVEKAKVMRDASVAQIALTDALDLTRSLTGEAKINAQAAIAAARDQ